MLLLLLLLCCVRACADTWEPLMFHLMKEVFGIHQFRTNQEAIIRATMAKVCRGGQSLAFSCVAILFAHFSA